MIIVSVKRDLCTGHFRQKRPVEISLSGGFKAFGMHTQADMYACIHVHACTCVIRLYAYMCTRTIIAHVCIHVHARGHVCVRTHALLFCVHGRRGAVGVFHVHAQSR